MEIEWSNVGAVGACVGAFAACATWCCHGLLMEQSLGPSVLCVGAFVVLRLHSAAMESNGESLKPALIRHYKGIIMPDLNLLRVNQQ